MRLSARGAPGPPAAQGPAAPGPPHRARRASLASVETAGGAAGAATDDGASTPALPSHPVTPSLQLSAAGGLLLLHATEDGARGERPALASALVGSPVGGISRAISRGGEQRSSAAPGEDAARGGSPVDGKLAGDSVPPTAGSKVIPRRPRMRGEAGRCEQHGKAVRTLATGADRRGQVQLMPWGVAQFS
jgi:hypothetical protein